MKPERDTSAEELVEVPSRFYQVRYNIEVHPLAGVTGLERGANCQHFVFELLRHFGYEIGPMRSSELWEDRTFTRRVRQTRPLDILMFNRTADAWGAHVALYLGRGRAIHLSKAVGKPAIWELAEFSKVHNCRVLVGVKRPIRRACGPSRKTTSAEELRENSTPRRKSFKTMWRLAKTSDDDAIVSMCIALNAEDPGPYPVLPTQVRRTLETLRQEPARGRAAVCEVEGQVVGYALLISFWSNELGGEVCVVDELFVRPEHRGRGLGTSLLEKLGARAEPLWDGIPAALALEVTAQNDRARALYERLGFEGRNLAMRRRLRRE